MSKFLTPACRLDMTVQSDSSGQVAVISMQQPDNLSSLD